MSIDPHILGIRDMIYFNAFCYISHQKMIKFWLTLEWVKEYQLWVDFNPQRAIMMLLTSKIFNFGRMLPFR